MNSKKGQVQETPQERALAEMAMAKMADYKTRWLPVQMRVAEVTRQMGAPDSFERKLARGSAAADTEQAFGQAEDQVESRQMNAGVGADSSKFRLGMTGMAADRGRSRGIAVAGADQAIDDAYIQGLQQVMALGRGVNNTAVRGLGDSARLGAQAAQSDAALAANRRMGQMQTAGTIAGLGIGAARGMDWGAGRMNVGGGTGEMMGTGAGPGDATGSFTGRF